MTAPEFRDGTRPTRVFDPDKVEHKYCAFVDVLGFSAATQRDFGSVLELYERLLEKSDFVASLSSAIQVTVVSDAFVLVSDKLEVVIGMTQTLQWQLLMEYCLVRGGIAYGKHAEGSKAGVQFVVSAALSKAVAIEKSIKHPCVAIDPSIELADGDWLNGRRSVLCYDGLRIVNPFTPFWFRTARTRITSLRAKHPDYAIKHDWLLALHGALLDQELLVPPDVVERACAAHGWTSIQFRWPARNYGDPVAPTDSPSKSTSTT
jgi:hypothetical protein